MGKTLIFRAKAALIALAGCWVMAPALHGPWIWDDDLYITRNPLLHSASGLARIWFAAPGVNYFPVTFTVQWLEWQAWGSGTAGYHAVNIALHILSAFLLWRILFRLGARQGWIGGLLFAVHPLAVESVAWISELKNCLSLPLVLLSFLAYIEYDGFLQEGREERHSGEAPALSEVERPVPRALRAPPAPSLLFSSRPPRSPCKKYLSAAVVLFVIAMLSKSTVAMFPFVLLLYAWWKRGTVRKSDVMSAAPFFAVSLALGLVTLWFEHHRAMAGLETAAPGGLLSRLGLAGLAIWFYLEKACLPHHLALIYPAPGVPPLGLAELAAWALLAIAAVGIWKSRSRHAAFGLGWFALNLAPLLGIVPIAYAHISWVSDHFAYAALPGIAGLAAAGFDWALGPPFLKRTAAGLAAAAIAVCFALQAHGRAETFSDGEVLWRHAVDRAPDSAEAHSNLGLVLTQRQRLPEAIAEFEKALQLKPGYPEIEGNLGLALLQAQRVPDGVAHLERAAQLEPASALAHYRLGMGLLLERRVDEGVAAEREAVRLDPQSADCHYGLGLALEVTDRDSQATAQYEQALRLDPDFAPARAALDRTKFGQKHFQ